MLEILIVAGILVCAIQAIRAPRLLVSAIWLAGTSALVALLMYLLGAPDVAVIELSVGAGLVTVLFVFAINIAGEEGLSLPSLLPKPLSLALVIISVLLIGWFSIPALNVALPAPQLGSLTTTMWDERTLDILLQVILIFAGVLGVLGLLAEPKPRSKEEGR